jgi:hypothetical protein
MNGFRLTLTLTAPVVFNHFTPLDATLCGILFGGREVDDITLGCIEYHDGVPLASLPILDNFKPLNYAMRPNIDRHLMDSRAVVDRLNPKNSTMMNGGDDSKNSVYNAGSSGRYFESGSIVYYFTGDGAKVRSIINEAGAVGGQISKGYGTIKRGTALLEKIDENLCGMYAEGKLARPIPISMARTLNVPKEEYMGAMGRSNAPYRPEEALQRGMRSEHIATPRRWVI